MQYPTLFVKGSTNLWDGSLMEFSKNRTYHRNLFIFVYEWILFNNQFKIDISSERNIFQNKEKNSYNGKPTLLVPCLY